MTTNFQTDLQRLNSPPANEVETELLKCCGSKAWARQVTALRPFDSVDELVGKADRVWWSLEPGDWLQAFDSHPKIGEKKAAARVAEQSRAWSEHEQAGIESSAADTLKTLAELNRAYQERFGFIFIVCATGKSSEEILENLRARLENPPDMELRIAAAEQAKITELRLRKLLAS